MSHPLRLESIYTPSETVVAREIEGEIVMIPITSGIGDAEDELYTLNETGRAIWQKLDGRRTLQDVVHELSDEFDCPPDEIEQDVTGFAEELLKRGMLVESAGV